MVRRLRVAVIGAGGWTETCHIPCLQADPRVEVVALCGRTQERVAAQAARFNIARQVSDYREVVAMADVDAVTISTPNASHFEIARAALGAGKHVFCEKPLAMNGEEGLALVRAARDSGLVNQVAFTFRHLYGVNLARTLLAEGVVGAPFHARFWTEGTWLQPDAPIRWRHQTRFAGTGILGDMGSHLIDLAHYLLGPFDSIYGRLGKAVHQRPDGHGGTALADADDVCTAIGRLRCGCDALFFCSWASGGKSHSGIEVQGTKGTLKIEYSRGGKDQVELWTAGEGWRSLPLPGVPEENHALYKMLKAFVDGMDGQAVPAAAASFVDGYRAQAVIDAIVAAAETGAAVAVQDLS